MESEKERLQIRSKCLADIVSTIDGWVEGNSHIGVADIYGLVDNTMMQFWKQLSREDYSHVQRYVGDYLEILVKHRGVIIEGYIEKDSVPKQKVADNGIMGYCDPYNSRTD